MKLSKGFLASIGIISFIVAAFCILGFLSTQIGFSDAGPKYSTVDFLIWGFGLLALILGIICMKKAFPKARSKLGAYNKLIDTKTKIN